MVEKNDFRGAGEFLYKLNGLGVINLHNIFCVAEVFGFRRPCIILETSNVEDGEIFFAPSVLHRDFLPVCDVVVIVPFIDIFIGTSTIRRGEVVRDCACDA